MKKFFRASIIALMALGAIAPLGEQNISASHIKSYQRVNRLAYHHGHRRHHGRVQQSIIYPVKRTRRHITKRHVRLGSNRNGSLGSVLARINEKDAPALQADRSSLEQVKSEAKEIAHEAKTSHLDKKAKREYLKEARSLYRQADRLLAECN